MRDEDEKWKVEMSKADFGFSPFAFVIGQFHRR
jgi:hypothetical protein